MAAITPTPLVIKDALVQFTDSYEKAVTAVVFTPSTSVITATAVSPGATYTDSTPATWTCDLTFLQDWEDPDSLARFLFDNEGVTLPITVEPKAGGTSFAATVVIVPGSVGGTVGTYAESTVSLGCLGKPVPTP